MESINFIKRNSLRNKLFQNPVRVPTEFQLITWENEGGNLYGANDDVVIINGILCQTWLDRVRASLRPIWKAVRTTVGHK